MASREKRALAPSKSRQKANNDNSISLSPSSNTENSSSNRISKKPTAAQLRSSLANNSRASNSSSSSSSQLTRDLVEAVASTGSQLPAKLEASLPRKRAVLQTALKRKQKARKTLIKAKQKQQQQQVVSKAGLKRLAAIDAKIGGLKGRRRNNAAVVVPDIVVETKYKCKTAKRNKTLVKAEVHRSEDQTSPKLGRRVLTISPRAKRAVKPSRKARNNLELIKKESEIIQIKQEIKSESEAEEEEAEEEEQEEEEESLGEDELKLIKSEPIIDNSIDDTIDQVIASSMLVDTGAAQVKVKEESEGAEFRGRKNARNNATAKRSLRNGKLRQTSAKIDSDTNQKKVNMSETSVESSMETKPVCLDGETAVVVKIEAPSEDESMASNNHCNDNSEHETNNNGCDENNISVVTSAEIGPTLRSKTKARNSDSSSETSEDVKPVVVASSNNKSVETEAAKKERTVGKLSEVKNSSSSSQNSATPKGRRNSLNIDVRRNQLISDKLSGKFIDDMVNKIKVSITEAIESQAKLKTENTPPVLVVSNFDAEVVAPLSNDSAVNSRLDEDVVVDDKSNITKNTDLGIGPSLTNKELSSEDAENSVPKVADTAKEIEKLVMGDIETVDTKPPLLPSSSSSEAQEEKNEKKPAVDGTASNPAIEPAEVHKNIEEEKQQEAAESCDDSEKDKQQPESAKKPAAAAISVKRKSPRSAAKAAAAAAVGSAEAKKLEKADEAAEEVAKAVAEEVPNKTALISENDEGASENKTVPVAKDSTEAAAAAKSTEPSDPQSSELPEKMDVDCVEESQDKCEETLESLSQEVERLVEANDDVDDKIKAKLLESEENDTSADEMRLVIDDSATETVNEATASVAATNATTTSCQPQQNNDNKEGCDQKSSIESSSDVQTVVEDDAATTAAATDSSSKVSVPKNSECEKIADTADAKTDGGKAPKASKMADAEKVEEQKETTRRSLRTRGDKQKKVEIAKPVPSAHDKSDKKSEDAATSAEVPSNITQSSVESADNSQKAANETQPIEEVIIKVEPEDRPQEPTIRTRRSREVKRPAPVPISTKGKRGPKKQESKKTDSQQNKEDSMLDNEVAKINENNRRPSSCLPTTSDSQRVVSANADSAEQKQHADDKNRSKSENDVASTSVITAEDVASACSAAMKNTDEGSTDGDSSSGAEQIRETPEDRAKKEAVLRQLGLESWERVKEREAKKGGEGKSESPKQQSSGLLKTVIRLQKEKEGKKRSRSPIKMVFNKQGRVDGEESSEFYKYTIQKETESGGGMGESSSGANRKLSTTNPRHSSDNNDEGEEAPLKDRQSLVIPEKSSSFSIHPERLCSDNCCYCFGKFGSLDTPMHLAQMKSDERRNKILVIETHITPDSCLCDACYRHIDRRANASPTALVTKPPRRNTHFHETKCIVRECNAPVKSHVKRKWLVKIKSHLMVKEDKKDDEEEVEERDEEDMKWKININWKAAQHNLVPFCEFHYGEIARFLKCVVCKRRLPRNSYFPLQLSDSAIQELNNRLAEMNIPTVVAPDTFFCKLCKFFSKLSFQPLETLSENNRNFFKNYRKRLLYCFEVEYSEEEDESETVLVTNPSMDKKRKETSRLSISIVNKKSKPGRKRSKSPSDRIETMSTSASDKSTPEPSRLDIIEPEVTIKESVATISAIVNTDSRCLSIEGAIEKLKKRKNLDTLGPSLQRQEPSNVMEILSRDKEVTLTRLPPKKPRLDTPSNDITPVVQRLGNNPSISVRTLFPGEEEMNLQAGVEFNNIREVTPQGWEKCMTVVQYDKDTKLLWQELQRPYGNMSSFLRHLVLLEKYYRSGDLILAPNASRNAINYSTSVQNRLISYEGPEKMDDSIAMDGPASIEYNNSRRLSGGYILENRSSSQPQPGTSSSSSNFVNVTAQLSKLEPSSRPVKLTPVVSIIKKPPPNLQRLNPSGSGTNGSAKRKESTPIQKVHNATNTVSLGGKMIQLSEPDYKRYQSLKKQKQIMNVKNNKSSSGGGSGSSSSGYGKSNSTTYAQRLHQNLLAQQQQQQQQSQFQKHLRLQQEMYARAGRSDFEPLVCDIRMANENTPTQNLINTLNLPKSIQVTTKTTTTSSSGPPSSATSMPIPILPKIPKSLTVIPQTVPRLQQAHDK